MNQPRSRLSDIGFFKIRVDLKNKNPKAEGLLEISPGKGRVLFAAAALGWTRRIPHGCKRRDAANLPSLKRRDAANLPTPQTKGHVYSFEA